MNAPAPEDEMFYGALVGAVVLGDIADTVWSGAAGPVGAVLGAVLGAAVSWWAHRVYRKPGGKAKRPQGT